jgi:hypothetical protein
VRFLFVFLAACGSSSAAVASSPILAENSAPAEEQEQELASAPIETEDATGCYCPEVTVRCVKPAGSHARADRATCTLDLPPQACVLFGFETGSTVSPEVVLGARAPSDPSADDVFEFCSTKHEAHHACDRRMDRPCAFEVDAYDVSLECMRAFAPDPTVAHQLEEVRAAREMNACLCGQSSCAACMAECKSNHPASEATCTQAQVYCP